MVSVSSVAAPEREKRHSDNIVSDVTKSDVSTHPRVQQTGDAPRSGAGLWLVHGACTVVVVVPVVLVVVVVLR